MFIIHIIFTLIFLYVVSERKLGFFVKVKEDQNFNHRNTFGISRIKKQNRMVTVAQ